MVPKRLGSTDLSCLQTVSHQYFWYHTTLNASSYIEEGIKSLVPNLTLGIFAAWFILFIIIITGLKISMPVSRPGPGPTATSRLPSLRSSSGPLS